MPEHEIHTVDLSGFHVGFVDMDAIGLLAKDPRKIKDLTISANLAGTVEAIHAKATQFKTKEGSFPVIGLPKDIKYLLDTVGFPGCPESLSTGRVEAIPDIYEERPDRVRHRIANTIMRRDIQF